MFEADKLLESTMKLFLKYGVKSVSMDDIAKKLGISKKTIYSVIENKKDLVYKVVVNFSQKEEQDILEITKCSSNAVEEMVSIGNYIFSFFRDMNPGLVFDLKKYHPTAWDYIEKDHLVFVQKTITDNVIKGQKAGLYRKDLHADIIAKLYIGQSQLILDEEIFPVREFTRSTLFTEFFLYHLNGITTDKGRKYLNNKINFK